MSVQKEQTKWNNQKLNNSIIIIVIIIIQNRNAYDILKKARKRERLYGRTKSASNNNIKRDFKGIR